LGYLVIKMIKSQMCWKKKNKKKINRKNQKNQEKEKKYIEKEKEKKHTDYHPVSFYVYFTFC
jgi:hypothetical protein